MSLKLSTGMYSPDHVGIALWELDRHIAYLRDASTRATVSKQGSEESVHLSAFLLGILSSAGVAADDLGKLESLQTQLETVRSSAPVVHVVLAALPSRSLKDRLVEWFRDNIHQQALITFAARGDIGGGFLLRVGSKQYDFTFRGQLLENKHRIAEIFEGK